MIKWQHCSYTQKLSPTASMDFNKLGLSPLYKPRKLSSLNMTCKQFTSPLYCLFLPKPTLPFSKPWICNRFLIVSSGYTTSLAHRPAPDPHNKLCRTPGTKKNIRRNYNCHILFGSLLGQLCSCWEYPADTRCWINVGLTLVHRLRRLTFCLVSVGYIFLQHYLLFSMVGIFEVYNDMIYISSRHKALNQCWFNDGPAL